MRCHSSFSGAIVEFFTRSSCKVQAQRQLFVLRVKRVRTARKIDGASISELSADLIKKRQLIFTFQSFKLDTAPIIKFHAFHRFHLCARLETHWKRLESIKNHIERKSKIVKNYYSSTRLSFANALPCAHTAFCFRSM